MLIVYLWKMGYYIFGEEEEFMLKKITNNIVYVGCDDHEIDLFEGQYPVKNGISYKSDVNVDEQLRRLLLWILLINQKQKHG